MQIIVSPKSDPKKETVMYDSKKYPKKLPSFREFLIDHKRIKPMSLKDYFKTKDPELFSKEQLRSLGFQYD